MKILVIGGLGFIGSNLVRECVRYKHQVSVYDNLDPHAGGNLYNIHDIKDDVEVHYHDILDFDRLAEHIVGKDIIVNCAASTSHPFSMREPWLDMDVNCRGVINILEAIRRYNPEAKFIHLGTSTQLGRLIYQPADEKHPEFPLDIYSANKSVSEKYVLIYAKAYHLRACVIRLSNVYGPRASIHSPEFTFNNYFLGLALQGKEIPIFGGGLYLRNFIYVEDAVEAVLLAANSEGSNGETFFVVGDEHLSVLNFAEKIVEIIGKGCIRSVPYPNNRQPMEIGDVQLSHQKISEWLKWQPKTNLSIGLEKTCAYYDTCLERYLK